MPPSPALSAWFVRLLEGIEHDEWRAASARFREPGSLRVVLVGVGPRTLDVVKAIREVLGLDVGRAKDLIRTTPTVVSAGVSQSSADHVADLLREAGASVRVESDGPGPPTAPPD